MTYLDEPPFASPASAVERGERRCHQSGETKKPLSHGPPSSPLKIYVYLGNSEKKRKAPLCSGIGAKHALVAGV